LGSISTSVRNGSKAVVWGQAGKQTFPTSVVGGKRTSAPVPAPVALTFDATYVLYLFLYAAPPPSATQDPDPNPDGAEIFAQSPDRAAERFAMLRELADIGMEIARALQSEVRARAETAVEDEAPQSVAELGLAFSRVSRAVRQTLALEARLEDERLDREQAAKVAEDAQSRSNSEMSEAGARVKAKLLRLLYPDHERDHQWDDEDVEDLSDEPDDERGEGFVSDRPAADVVAGVCGDLGIEPDLSLWVGEDSVAASATRGDGGASPAAFEQHREAAATSPPDPDGGRGRPP
jgi:hypothetical protein